MACLSLAADNGPDCCNLLPKPPALLLLCAVELLLQLLCGLNGYFLQRLPLCCWVEPRAGRLELLYCLP